MGGLDKGSHWLTLPTSGRIKRTPNPRLDRERVQQSWGAFTGASENASPFEHRDKGDAFSPALLLVPRELPAAILIQGYFAMQNGRKTPRHFKPGTPPISRSKRWTPNTARPSANVLASAQRNYERYLALAQEEARSGNVVAAENYYQHAEHYYRSMSRDRNGTS